MTELSVGQKILRVLGIGGAAVSSGAVASPPDTLQQAIQQPESAVVQEDTTVRPDIVFTPTPEAPVNPKPSQPAPETQSRRARILSEEEREKLPKINVEVTLKRDVPYKVLPNGYRTGSTQDYVYGPGFSLPRAPGATGFSIEFEGLTREEAVKKEEGFLEATGGVDPKSDSPVRINAFIRDNKPNGIYSGSKVVYSKIGDEYVPQAIANYKIELTG